MKRLFIALVIVFLCVSPASGDNRRYIEISSSNMMGDAYFDGVVTHLPETIVIPGARAQVCVNGVCSWYTSDKNGSAGFWINEGDAYTITPSRPLGFPLCNLYRVYVWDGPVFTRVSVVWTGYCQASDTKWIDEPQNIQ